LKKSNFFVNGSLFTEGKFYVSAWPIAMPSSDIFFVCFSPPPRHGEYCAILQPINNLSHLFAVAIENEDI